MLQNMREKLSGPVSIAVLGLIAVAFIFWGIDFGFFNRDFVAKVNGEEIPNSRFSAAYQNQLGELAREARSKWPLTGCVVVHRLGHLEVGQTSVAIAVSSPHRQEAFQAGQWLIDRIKEVVPIWKKENYTDGTTDWVHPEK